MKRMLFALMIACLVQNFALGSPALELDLFNGSLNGIELFGSQTRDPDIERLLGKCNEFGLSASNEYTLYYPEKGVILYYNSGFKLDSIDIYLCKTYDMQTKILPFPGNISGGITSETNVSEFQNLFKAYKQKKIKKYNDYILVYMGKYFLYGYYDNETQKIIHLDMRHDDFSVYDEK